VQVRYITIETKEVSHITKRNSHLEINIRENGMDNPETALGIQDTGRPQTEQKTLHRKLKR
jgi:hypothetical protein